jgi:hypothetical protein
MCRDAILDQPQRFAPDRFQQAVGDKGLDFLFHVQGMHAERVVNLACALDGIRRGFFAADQFHQRQQVNRVERMPH